MQPDIQFGMKWCCNIASIAFQIKFQPKLYNMHFSMFEASLYEDVSETFCFSY